MVTVARTSVGISAAAPVTSDQSRLRPWRRLLPYLLCGAVACLPGCGQSDEDDVRESASNFQDAVLAGDGRDACALMSRPALEGFERDARLLARHYEDGYESCESYLSKVSAADGKPGGEKALISSVEVDSGSARVRLDSELDGIGRVLPLREQDGKWRIDLFADARDLGESLAPPRRCLDSWNAAAGTVDTGWWADHPPEEMWAELFESPDGCGLILQTPIEQVVFDDRDGWKQSGPSVPRDEGAGVRNVWLDASGTASPSSERAPPHPTVPSAEDQVALAGGKARFPGVGARLQVAPETVELPDGKLATDIYWLDWGSDEPLGNGFVSDEAVEVHLTDPRTCSGGPVYARGEVYFYDSERRVSLTAGC